MGDPQTHPYETRSDVLYTSLKAVYVKALTDACEYTWYTQTLCHATDSLVRPSVVQGASPAQARQRR